MCPVRPCIPTYYLVVEPPRAGGNGINVSALFGSFLAVEPLRPGRNFVHIVGLVDCIVRRFGALLVVETFPASRNIIDIGRSLISLVAEPL